VGFLKDERRLNGMKRRSIVSATGSLVPPVAMTRARRHLVSKNLPQDPDIILKFGLSA